MTTQSNDPVERARKVLHTKPSALITDIDGTISPMAINAVDASVTPAARRALRTLRSKLDTVSVISGRSVLDARRMVRVSGLTYIGNHGMEWLHDRTLKRDDRVLPFLAPLQSCLEEITPILDRAGLNVENKGCTASLHYRRAPRPAEARAAILSAIKNCELCASLRVAEGRMVVNLLPPVGITKGTAILELTAKRGWQGIVYLGDDVTDLDAFAALSELRREGRFTLSIAVNSPEAPSDLIDQADEILGSVSDVVAFMTALAESEL